MKARVRIQRVVEKWFLAEPALFGAWTTHALAVAPGVRNIRVQHGRIEYNPDFVLALNPADLETVLICEALRILLKHPYARRKDHAELAYEASNLTLQEALHSALPIPSARQRFGTDAHDDQYFEYYYGLLERLAGAAADRRLDGGQAAAATGAESGAETEAGAGAEAGAAAAGSEAAQGGPGSGQGGGPGSALGDYADPRVSGPENAKDWAPDELLADRIDQVIRGARESNQWGSITGGLRERILATLRPILDYGAVLRQFRTSIVSMQRTRTRMRPNRRYGFDYLGSRREYSTRLLLAVDVSGSMASDDLRRGFSLIRRFFDYGVPSIDVIQFDSVITGPPQTLRRARHSIEVIGRGGTDFADLMRFIGAHRDYDGLIVFTDGYAPVPPRPDNRRTRILWLFNSEAAYRASYPPLKHLGRGVFLRPGASAG